MESRSAARCSAVSAWREILAAGSLATVVATLAYGPSISGRSVSGWLEVGGVTLAAAGEEVVYRLAAVLFVGAACARIWGHNWRDTARWGTGPIVVAMIGAAVVFSVLPGHVEQMTGATSVVPFASLAVLLGYAALRTGSVLPGIVVHVLLDVVTLAYFAGQVSASSRSAVAATALVALVLGLMLAGRRLRLRCRIPTVIDLRDQPVACAQQQFADFGVGRLAEILVPLTNRRERLRACDADHVVGDTTELDEGVPGCDRYRERHAPSSMGTRHFDRGAGGAAGRQAVVDHDDGPALEWDHRRSVTVLLRASLELCPFSFGDAAQCALGDRQVSDHFRIEDAYAVFPDRPHSELGLRRYAQLAHDDDVQWSIQRDRHLERDRHTAPWEGEDDRVLGRGNRLRDQCREQTAGFSAIAEWQSGAHTREW